MICGVVAFKVTRAIETRTAFFEPPAPGGAVQFTRVVVHAETRMQGRCSCGFPVTERKLSCTRLVAASPKS
jgi:hypothetical protein